MKFNRTNAGIALIGLLGLASALGTAAYNYSRFQILQIKSEDLRLQKEREEKRFGVLPIFDTLYPESTDYKKMIVKKSEREPKAKPKTKGPAKPKSEEAPSYKLMKCWKCKKPFRVQAGLKRGKCPHCGAGWALK